MQDDDGTQPSSKEKGHIHAIIAQEVFDNDVHYGSHYKAYPQKFTVANHLALMQRARFNQTGGGVDPSDPNAAVNLREDVLRQLPTYDDLDELWHSIPSYAPKAFLSDHTVDHSSCLLSIVQTKSAPPSTSAASSCPALDNNNNNDLYNTDNNELDDTDPSQDLPLTSTDNPQQLIQIPFADENDEHNYDMVEDGAMTSDVNAGDGDGDGDGDGEMNTNGNEDYEMMEHETNHVDKRPCPFSPSPPPEATISSMISPHTPPCWPPLSVASSTISSSMQPCSSAPTRLLSSNPSSSTKAKSIKCVQSDIADVRDKMQLLVQGVIHEKEQDQMFSPSQQLIQQSSSSLEHQCMIETKNADIRLEQAKAQTHASEMELLCLKLQLGEQQDLQLQSTTPSLPATSESSS
ncbi:hypothetical protein BDR04DRAFT_1152589 [Suillus decipiens]|nr:hypothetical protein BDR04DRAFT_1152589 [Suillus decipiens]